MTTKEIFDVFSSLGNDTERWQWLQENQDKDIVVLCDNDSTYIQVEGQEGYADFDNFVGNDDGIFSLIRAFGVRAENV